MEKIIVLGKGGHTKSLTDIIERQNKYEIAGYIVNDVEQETGEESYPVIGNDEALPKLFQSGIKYAAMGIGYLGHSDLRERLWRLLKKIGYSLPVIRDPSAIVANHISIGEGTMIGKGAIINANAVIGKMCIVNTGAIVEHDCIIADFSHISVGSVLCGNVQVGRETFVGANATVIQGMCIGNRCVIGAGTTLRRNVEDYCMVKDEKMVRISRGGGKIAARKGRAA